MSTNDRSLSVFRAEGPSYHLCAQLRPGECVYQIHGFPLGHLEFRRQRVSLKSVKQRSSLYPTLVQSTRDSRCSKTDHSVLREHRLNITPGMTTLTAR